MKKILIVEDVELNLELLIQLLEDKYELVSASDGMSGVAIAEQQKPNLILMDMSLPVMNGWTAVQEIKANPKLAMIPIIGLSAHAMNEERQRALESGCDEYLTKPVDEDLLFKTIERFIKKEQDT
jgi:two-component system cell cycle response regulator DivK